MSSTMTIRIDTARKSLICVVLSFICIGGCATPWERSLLLKDTTPNIERVQGPTQRSLRNIFRKKQDEDGEDFAGKSLKPIAGTDEYLAATELFKEERYDEARAAFKKVAKKFKKSEIREDALFMQAEADWQQEHYATAHDAYAVLLKEYPSTRHLNVVSERMFKLGRMWLDFPEVAKLGEIHQVNFDQPSKALPSDEPPKMPKAKPLFVPNFRNKKEPLFDTPGNGVAALSAVWMHDPTGPLADDAMMLVASYHARKGNYVEADRFFQMLRETFPNSPHVQNAFVLGSHVKLMSYQGPNYETRTLREAQALKESTIRLYPNLPESDRIKDELARIEDAKALVIWTSVEFYMRKKNKRAAAIYCHQVINEYPKSQYARQAKAKLVELGPEYESGAAFLTNRDDKSDNLLIRILETPPTYKLKKYPMIGPARDMSKPAKKKPTNSDNVISKGKPKTDEQDDSQPQMEGEKPDEIDQDPDSPAQPLLRPRSKPPFGSPGDDSDAPDMEAKRNGPGRIGRISF